ncbi:MAG: hypothetical protein O3B75_05880 [Planctomycetota bacterium]|nr:hypothetical protein [Planctomycetota bacterium]
MHNSFISFACVGVIACVGLTSCAEEEAPPPPPVVRIEPPPPPPPEPTIKSIAELMDEYKIDDRVNLLETFAPDTNEKRIAVLKFWNAFAKGDSQYAGQHMAKLDSNVLAALVKKGQWEITTSKITSIEVQCKDENEGFATFGLITSNGIEQPMLWDAEMSSDEATFTAFPGTGDIMSHLSGEDSIAAWKTYINGLLEKYSNKPDEEVEIVQEDLQLAEGDDPASGGDGGETPAAPGGGAGGGALRKKPHAPIK